MNRVPEKIDVTDFSGLVSYKDKFEGLDVMTTYQTDVYTKSPFLFYNYLPINVIGIRFWPLSDKIELIKLACTQEVAIQNFTINKEEQIRVLDEFCEGWRHINTVTFFDTSRKKQLSASDFQSPFPVMNSDGGLLFVSASVEYKPKMDMIYVINAGQTAKNLISNSIIFMSELLFSTDMSKGKGKGNGEMGKLICYNLISSFLSEKMNYPEIEFVNNDWYPSLESKNDVPIAAENPKYSFKELDAIASLIKFRVENKPHTVEKEDDEWVSLSELINMGIDEMSKAIDDKESLSILIDIETETIKSAILKQSGIYVYTFKETTKIEELCEKLDTDNVIMIHPSGAIVTNGQSTDVEDDSPYQLDMMCG
jgi:hypothetical protein